MTSRHFHVLYFRKTHSDKQWNFNHQQWFLNNNACTENKSFPLTHTHTHTLVKNAIYTVVIHLMYHVVHYH